MDFNVIMCFCGNDFVKAFLFSKSNNNHTINKLLMPVYEGIFDKIKENLISIKGKKIKINNKFFKMIIEDFAKNEDKLYKNYYRYDIDFVMSGKKKQREQKYDSEYQKQLSIFEHTPIHSPDNIYLYKKYISEFTKIKYKLKHHIWRKQYYKYYFNLDINKKKSRNELVEIVKEYLKSILWVQYYYFLDCPSWSWYYKYRVTPLPSDILDVLNNEVTDINLLSEEFDLGKPYTPFQQLMFILPRQLISTLPKSKEFKKIVDKYDELYPTEFDIDVTVGHKYWNCHAILPHFNDNIINDVKNVEKTLSSKANIITEDI
jgi:5'-3' exonuclease